jgi:CHAT domain-containing protein
VLHDRDMKTGPLGRFFGANPPLLCFMNGCETGMTAPAWKDSFDIYGLAWAFLETGSYLIGSRWKVDDETAKSFAARFYTALLREGKALGPAVTEARRECFQAPRADDLGWASYVLYGDPRMGFRGRRFAASLRSRARGNEPRVRSS